MLLPLLALAEHWPIVVEAVEEEEVALQVEEFLPVSMQAI